MAEHTQESIRGAWRIIAQVPMVDLWNACWLCQIAYQYGQVRPHSAMPRLVGFEL